MEVRSNHDHPSPRRLMTTTLHEISRERTSFDPDEFLKELREEGIVEIDEALEYFHSRRQQNIGDASVGQPEFERGMRDKLVAVELALNVSDLERLAPTADGIIVDGERYVALAPSVLRVLFMSGWGSVVRRLYRARGGHGGETFDVLATQIGLVGESTTLAATRIISSQMQASPAAVASSSIAEHRTMRPSAAHLGRIMEALGSVVEENREEVEEAVRVRELVAERLPAPELVALVAVSLDGIMIRMKDAPNTPGASREAETPKGHKEAACATLSYYDVDGVRLHTTRLARMPESKKVTLHAQLEAELRSAIERCPNARVMAIGDAAKENWRIFGEIARSLRIQYSCDVVDYFHAKDHLVDALKQSGAHKSAISRWKEILLKDEDGADQVLQELMRRREFKRFTNSAKRLKKFDKEVTYFNNNGHRMNYAKLTAQNLPIGSGVQEAACKTLFSQRMKLSGQSWLLPGGQAIATIRSFEQSGRFGLAWIEFEPLFRRRTYEVDPSRARQRPSWSRVASRTNQASVEPT